MKTHGKKEFKSSSTVSVSQNPKLNCIHCGASISRKNMSRHIMRFHTEDRVIKTEKFKCDTCGENVSSEDDLVNHKTDEENCMNYMKSLINDEIKRESEPTFMDDSVNDVVEEESDTTTKSDSVNDMVEGESDDKSMNWLINDEVNLDVHRFTSAPFKVPKHCNICNLSISAANFSRHMKAKHGEEIISVKKANISPSTKTTCDVCEIEVSGSYAKHTRGAVHLEMMHQKETGFKNSGSVGFKCSKCFKTFEKKKNFGMHLLKVHSKI